MQRVIGYIDGFNLYHGLKQRKWRQFYWIDPFTLVASLLVPTQQLVQVKYFTARVRQPKAKRDRQSKYLDAIRAHSQAEIILGKYYRKPQQCRNCGKIHTTFEEKMTDCAIASHMVADAFRDQFDVAVLVGGDTDLVPPVKMVRRWFPEKRIIGWFPPARKNQAVADACHDEGHINGSHLALAIMPGKIEVAARSAGRAPASMVLICQRANSPNRYLFHVIYAAALLGEALLCPGSGHMHLRLSVCSIPNRLAQH